MRKNQEDYGIELQKSFDRWRYVYEHGATDPAWEDGVNLNLVRNHILYYRRKIEENHLPSDYPAAYFKEIPPEVDQKFMARPDEIREAAKASLERYRADSSYQYILRHKQDFTLKTQEKFNIHTVVNYVTGLAHDIENENLVAMRRHENNESYIQLFEKCASQMRCIPADEMQLSFFFD